MVVKKVAAKAVKKPVAKKAVAKKPSVPRKPAKTGVAKAVVKAPAKAIAAKVKKDRKAASKEKVLRDSFSMPKSDFDKIAELKALCTKQGMYVKKSELLRAGLHALSKMNAAQLKQAVAGLEVVKTGRPKKG